MVTVFPAIVAVVVSGGLAGDFCWASALEARARQQAAIRSRFIDRFSSRLEHGKPARTHGGNCRGFREHRKRHAESWELGAWSWAAEFCTRPPRVSLSIARLRSPSIGRLDGNLQDLSVSSPGCAEVRDIKVAVRTEGHGGGDGEPGDDILDLSAVQETHDLAVAEAGISCRGVELENIEQAVRTKRGADDGGESGARAGDADVERVVGRGLQSGHPPASGPRCVMRQGHDASGG